MQQLRCTVNYREDAARQPEDRGTGQRVDALLTRDHPSTSRGVPVVVVAGRALGASELGGAVRLADTPPDAEAEALVRSARMNGYAVESDR